MPLHRLLLRSLAISVAAVSLILAGCQSKLIYHPRGYSPQTLREVNARPLSYEVASKRQCAWLCPKVSTASPERVWLVFGGNGSVALDFADYFPEEMLKTDLFVLLDYPSYGQSEGSPTPDSIQQSILELVPAVASQLGMPEAELQPRLRVFGHSLGASAALMAVEQHRISSGVLIAPFTSMKDMARKLIGWPLCELLHHRFDNVATLQRLAAQKPELQLIHGTADEVIPFTQGQTLATQFPTIIHFTKAEGGRHSHILHTHYQEIISLLKAARH